MVAQFVGAGLRRQVMLGLRTLVVKAAGKLKAATLRQAVGALRQRQRPCRLGLLFQDPREPASCQLFGPRQRTHLSQQLGDFTPRRDRSGGVAAMLKRVAVTLRSAGG